MILLRALSGYAFRGSDPDGARNQWLRDAMSRRLPLIYFYGIAPAVYEPLFPAFVIHWEPNFLSCGLSFSGEADSLAAPAAPDSAERRYTLGLIRQRLHQAIFREQVRHAYGRRCALSGLAETRLIDAAHIIPDSNERFGQPDIPNGICMSKIHHAAFDAGLIGIDPDYRVHISERLLTLRDGRILEHGLKALRGHLIRVPADSRFAPDRERLSARFGLFRSAR